MSKPEAVSPYATDDALKRAWRVQAAMSARGFDWPDVQGVLDKVKEEVGEIEDAVDGGDVDHARRELGDLLLVTINLARFLGADPARALHAAVDVFENRCQMLEDVLSRRGLKMESCTLAQLDSVWEEVKVLAAQGRDSGA
ncbi:MAG: hypothetical protein IT368_18530 [Candidatus Hydrogenedentes bacterium]|nr:hypothetical protein [Candidatus Hydrogenedentota bacterium]